MRKLKQTYRFLSVGVLIAVALNIVLPASFAMGHYICDMVYMEHPGSAVGIDGCCSQQDTDDMYDQKALGFFNQSCFLELDCERTLTNEWSESLINLAGTKYQIVVTATSAMLQRPFDWNARNQLFLDKTISFTFTPIFLLNSAFLN